MGSEMCIRDRYMDEQNNEDHEKQSAYDDIADGCTERILDCLAICKEETH